MATIQEKFNIIDDYYSRGYECFPCQPNSKIPAVKWKSTTFTAEELKSYVKDNPDCNLAVKTGKTSKLFVLDCDDEETFNTYHAMFPNAPYVRTPRGGGHIYFARGDFDFSIGVSIAPHTDYRSDGGYALIPGSHVKYETGFEGDYTVGATGVAPDLPDVIAQKIINHKKEKVEGTTQKELLYRVMSLGFNEHEHNDEVFQVAAYLAGSGTPLSVAYQILSALDEKDATPQGDEALKATLKSAYARVNADKKIKLSAPFSTITASEFVESYQNYNVDWIIQDWLPRHSIYMVAAPPETFKTWFGLAAVICTALGAPFAGQFPIKKKGPVLVIQQEDYPGLVAQRVRTLVNVASKDVVYQYQEHDWGISFDSPWFSHIDIHPDSAFRLDNPASVQALDALIAKNKYELVFIDPLYSLAPATDYFKDMPLYLMNLKNMRNKYGTSFMIAHHMKKGGEGREGVLGSNMMQGAVEGLWIMKPEGDKSFTITRTGKFIKERKHLLVNMSINTEPGEEAFIVEVDEEGAKVPGKNNQDILDLLEDSSRAMKNNEIAKALNIQPSSAKAALDKLIKEGMILRDNYGAYLLKPEFG